ncbi:hypothetical protein PG990_012551 [Apiospora arundinis]|uniref:DUF3752 domain-containing protein n=1 Tax=Apiospora arundinis TaxID=335852 RepID=A0ABR2HQW5_9PEZI
MSSIGPQLPPHLAKRKRSVDDDEAEAGSPPPKIHATGPQLPSNRDEITLDDDDSSGDDDAYGPSIPKAAMEAKQENNKPSIGPAMPTSIGPAMPPTAAPSISAAAPPPSIGPSAGPTNTDEIDLADSDDDDASHGPAPPPSGPQQPQQPKRIHGPAPPPGPLSERPPNPPDSDSDSDDDDYGPALPTSSAHQARQSQAAAALYSARQAAESTAPQRDDWMLAPPSGGDLNHAQDPTKLKARKFNSGPRASTSGGGEISSIWTETPEQKRKRLEDAVLGRSSAAASGQPQQGQKGAVAAGVPKTREEEERAERIRENIQKARGPSLLEAHQRSDGKGNARAVEEEEDDPSKRAFDKEKDMKLGGRIGNAQRNELLKRSANFGDRFSKGKYL